MQTLKSFLEAKLLLPLSSHIITSTLVFFKGMKLAVRADLEDTTCNLILIFQVSCHMQRKSRLDISYNLYSRRRGYQNKSHLKREDHRSHGSDFHHLSPTTY